LVDTPLQEPSRRTLATAALSTVADPSTDSVTGIVTAGRLIDDHRHAR